MHIAILFVNFGGYHHARLEAVQRTCLDAGWKLTAIQVTDDQLDHPWGSIETETPFPLVTLLPSGDRPEQVREATFSGVAAQELRRWLNQARPDVVFIPGWSLPVARAALAWCAAAGSIPIMMSESKEDDAPRVWWREQMKKWMIGRCSAALVGGAPQYDYMVQLGMPQERIAMRYAVVDNAYFAAASDAVRSDPEPVRASLGLPERFFLASSRFIPRKNLHRLLDAFAAYRRRAGPEAWGLVILGDGELRPELIARRSALGLDDVVSLPGFIDYETLPGYYGLAGAFVHVSTTEQWGLVVNEAMASGLPVLVSETCGCVRDLIQPGENGFMFDPGNVDELADRLSWFTAHAHELPAMGESSRRIISAWTPEAFADSVRRLVEQVLQNSRKPAGAVNRLLLSAAAGL